MLSEVFPIPAALGATESIVTAAASFIVAVFLCWASIVLYYDKNKWRPLDTLVFLLLLECILKQVTTVLYSSLILLQPLQTASWCPAILWLLAGTHTLQASTLTTLALSVLLRVRMPRSKYRETLSKSHLAYHFGCLLLLSCSVGVAAILAQSKDDTCVPYQDKRYLIFYLTLHFSLMLSSFFALVYSCVCRSATTVDYGKVVTLSSTGTAFNSRQLLLNSSSDISSALSDISMISTTKSKHSPSVDRQKISFKNSPTVAEKLLEVSSDNNIRTSPSSISFAGQQYHNNNYPLPPPPPGHPIKVARANSVRTSEFNNDGLTPVHLPPYDNADNSSIYTSKYPLNANVAPPPAYLSSCGTSSSSNSRSVRYFNPCVMMPEDICLATVSAIISMTYLVDHIPLLASTMIMTAVPEYLPVNWPYKTFPLWTALIEGCLMPIVLFMFDEQFSLRVSSLYASSSNSDKGIYGKFRAYNGTLLDSSPPEIAETVRFPLTNGSLFTNVDGLPTVHIHRRPRGIRKNSCAGIHSSPLSMNASKQPWYLITAAERNLTKSPSVPFVAGVTKFKMLNDPSSGANNKISAGRRNSVNTTSSCSLKFDQSRASRRGSERIKQQLEKSLFCNDCSSTALHLDQSEYECGGDSSIDEPVYATLSAYSSYSATTAANDDFEFYRHTVLPSHQPSNQSTNLPYQQFAKDDFPPAPAAAVPRNSAQSKHKPLSRKCSSPISRLNYVTENKLNYYKPENIATQFDLDDIKKEQQPESYDTFWCQSLSSSKREEPKLRHSIQPLKVKMPRAGTPALHRRNTSVLSVDSLVNALNNHQIISYLDTGDLCKHPAYYYHTSSVPDLKKIFITDFL